MALPGAGVDDVGVATTGAVSSRGGSGEGARRRSVELERERAGMQEAASTTVSSATRCRHGERDTVL